VTSEILEELEADLEFSLADGYRLELGGDSESRQDAVDKLLLYLPLLLTIMVAVLVLSTSSLRLTGLLLSVGLFAIGLGMLALGISGYPLGFNPIIGSTSLVGIALNDSIVVLAAIRSNSRAQAGNLAAIARETMGCGRHVLATTLTTAGGFLPLLLFVGGNFWPPLAIVIAGGVLGATVIALMYVPIAYVLLRRLAPLAGERARER
jgi:multidrug efflux pump subunit AcrB